MSEEEEDHEQKDEDEEEEGKRFYTTIAAILSISWTYNQPQYQANSSCRPAL
jgi:hypothetical protein